MRGLLEELIAAHESKTARRWVVIEWHWNTVTNKYTMNKYWFANYTIALNKLRQVNKRGVQMAALIRE